MHRKLYLRRIALALLVAGISISTSLHSQVADQISRIPVDVYDFGSTCYSLLRIDSAEVGDYHFALPFCIEPDVPESLKGSPNFLIVHSKEFVQEVERDCFLVDASADPGLMLWYVYVFLDCRIASLSIAGKPYKLSSRPEETRSLELVGEYLLSGLIFPGIVSQVDVVQFGVGRQPIVPTWGRWWLEGFAATKIGTWGPRSHLAIFEATLRSEPGRKPSLTYELGGLDINVPLPGLQILPVEDQFVEESCSAPPKEVNPGDTICIPRVGAQDAEVALEDGARFAPLPPIAQSSRTAYFEIPNDDWEVLKVVRGESRLTIKISKTWGSKVHQCDCIARSELDAKAMPSLTSAEIKRLQLIVYSALSNADAIWSAGRARLKVAAKNMYAKEDVVAIVEEGKIAALEEIRKEPLLIGLYDYINEKIGQEIYGFAHAIEPSPISASGRYFRSRVVSASMRQRDLVSRKAADTLLKALKEIMNIVRVQNEHPVVSLEVQTIPAGALFSMHPKSYSPLKYETATNGRLVNVWMGRYVFNIARRNFEGVASSSELDLVGDRRPQLKCVLNPKGLGHSLCVRE